MINHEPAAVIQNHPTRYSDVAVALHWSIALLIIGLLAIGKYMTGLEENDPIRFVLTQWHKTFGIMVLLLSVIRLLWRFTHAAPSHPPGAAAWEKLAASGTHVLFYGFLFALPMTGWIMASASPLNVDTLLFNVIPWPHLPPFATLENRAAIAENFHNYHAWAGNALIALLLLHIGAALKHHVIDKDDVLRRMAPDWSSISFRRLTKGSAAALIVAAAGIGGYASIAGSGSVGGAVLGAGASEVTFVATVSGSEVHGVFNESSVTATLNENDPAGSVLEATVQTATFDTDNPQVSGSLGDKDWFNTTEFPQATFVSTAFTADDPGALQVTGDLTMKDTTLPISFSLSIADTESGREATGVFDINRLDYQIGAKAQPDDEYVDLIVSIRFRFDLTAPGAT